MKHLVLFCFILIVGCKNNVEVEELSNTIRVKHKQYLKKMPSIDYVNIFSKNPSKAEADLGRLLFNDPILSRNNDTSCATCHLTNHGFADGNRIGVGSMGVGGPNGNNVSEVFGEGVTSINRHFGTDGYGHKAKRKMFRNSLSTVNVGYRVNKTTDSGLLWDGRFGDLLFQVLLPIHTPEELCGQNPLSQNEENIFKPGGEIFKKPIKIYQSVFSDPYSGKSKNVLGGKVVTVEGIPKFRKNGSISVPNRNECLALAMSKLNAIPKYRELFKDVYGITQIDDRFVASALAMFITTHVSKNTKYDKFVEGENVFSKKELLGFSMFVTKYGEKFEFNKKQYTGAGCVKCHAPPSFDKEEYYSLGVKSDADSDLAKPKFQEQFQGGFFHRPRLSTGTPPKCHIKNISMSADGNYAPDIGRANSEFTDEACFKFRIPTLRNVKATYPYFHHGTEFGESYKFTSVEEQASIALKNTIKYHLRGPVNTKVWGINNYPKIFFDRLFQRDPLIPFHQQDFGFEGAPVSFNDTEIDALFEFVKEGLSDPNSTVIGDLNNDVTHPKRVPSGLLPTITRDDGTQYDKVPNMK